MSEEDREICSYAYFDITDQYIRCANGTHEVSVADVVRHFNDKYSTARVIEAVECTGSTWNLWVVDAKSIKIKCVS